MKKAFSLVCLIAISAFAFAQQSVNFKLQYKPNHQYVMNNKIGADMTMDLKGDSAEVAKMKNGTPFPMVIKMDMDMGTHLTTGVAEPGKTIIPATLTFDGFDMKSVMNGKPMPGLPTTNPLTGLTLKGWCTDDGKIQYDTTATAGDLSVTLYKQLMVKSINDMIAKLKFPEKPMQIGDTFEQVIDQNSPIPSMNLTYKMKTVYKLISVSNGMANFTTVQTAIFDMSGKAAGTEMDMKGGGSGDGTMKFDIAQNFIVDMKSSFNLDYDIKVQTVHMLAKARMTTSSAINISGN